MGDMSSKSFVMFRAISWIVQLAGRGDAPRIHTKGALPLSVDCERLEEMTS
jgi:hypothetical protein